MSRAMDNRRSYGMESVEDDPFIVAASMQSMNTDDGKKKKQDHSVNYGYLSQGMDSTRLSGSGDNRKKRAGTGDSPQSSLVFPFASPRFCVLPTNGELGTC